MATKRARSRGGRRFEINVHKPHGVIQPRVQKVGPEHFGILSIDCAKVRSKFMLANFYGAVLLPPQPVEHTRGHIQAMLDQVRQTSAQHELRCFAWFALPLLGSWIAWAQHRSARSTFQWGCLWS